MPKEGLVFDYDLRANDEIPKQSICQICGEELHCRWTDYSGEGVCLTCGAPYQLKWGTEEQKQDNKYPYLNINPKYIPIIKEYWEQTKKFVFLGTSLTENTGIADFNAWMEENHADMIPKE